MIYSLDVIQEQLSKKQFAKFKDLLEKYKKYDKVDILIELSKKKRLKLLK